MNYIEEAHKTLSTSFHGDCIRFDDLTGALTDAINALARLDSIKKALFYGKTNLDFAPAAPFEANCDNAITWIAANERDEPRIRNILHAIIGKATESGELLEALLKAVTGESVLDEVNISEEIGDGLWYDAILLAAIGSDFELAQQVNINKLRARFPDKFSEESANNRNLSKEREILEQKTIAVPEFRLESLKYFTERGGFIVIHGVTGSAKENVKQVLLKIDKNLKIKENNRQN